MTDGWLQFFDFSRDPFEPVRNSDLLFLAGSRQGLVAGILQDVLAGAPVVPLRADRGLGKSSLLRLVATRLRMHGVPVVEAGAATTPLQLQLLLGEAAGIPDCDAMTPDQLTQALHLRTGAPSMALVLDDADQLPVAGFRMLALLQQLFAFRSMTLRLVLVGAPGRWAGVDQPDLEDLRQHCISHLAMFPLREDECRPYLEHKIGRAGVKLNRVMSKAAVLALGRESGGVPARLDALARDMLDAAYRRRRRRITLPMAWPAVSPDRSWTLPLTMVALRSPWLAAFGVMLLAGTAGLAYVRRDDLAASLDLRAAADTFAMALSSRDADEGEPEPPPLASLPAPASQQPALPLDAASTRLGPARSSLAGRAPTSMAQAEPAPPEAQPLPTTPGQAVQADPKPAGPALANPWPAQAGLSPSGPAAPMPSQAADATPQAVQRPDPPTPPVPPSASVEPQRTEPDPAESRERPATPAPVNEASREVEVPEMRALSMPPRSPHGGPGLMLVAGEADTLPTLYARVYRGVIPPPYSALLAANRGPIRPGTLLIFPEPPNGWAAR